MNRGSLILIGALLIGILAFVCLTVHWPKIEQDLAARASAALTQADMSWAEIEISGRDLTLRGMAPSVSAIDKARTVAAGVRGVRKVTPDFDIPAGGVPVGPLQEATIPNEAPSAILTHETPSGDDSAPDMQADVPTPVEDLAEPEALTAESCQSELNRTLASRTIRFGKNSADIEAASQPLLDEIAAIVDRCPGVNIEVSGHTDSGGPEDWNRELSGLRARAVVDNLRAQGVPRSRLRSIGRGSSQPIADDSTAEGRSLNRRIEFTVL